MLDRKSLEVRAADALVNAIVLGKIASGTRLTEIQLAEDLEASRGTARAALMKVCAAGDCSGSIRVGKSFTFTAGYLELLRRGRSRHGRSPTIEQGRSNVQRW